MWIDGEMEADSFTVVRELLERNFACMGVTCSQVRQYMLRKGPLPSMRVVIGSLDTIRETEMHCFTNFSRLGLFWTRLLGSTWLESPAKKQDSQLGLLLASLLPSSCSFFFLHSEFSHS